MSFLTDADLDALIRSAKPPLLETGNFALSTSGTAENPSQVQPCSIDLRIDEIFLPSVEGSDQILRTRSHDLKVGESVRVSTIERFELPSDIGALLFAPARVSRLGILVPDIGHVDPGFDGPVRLTLINVGKRPQRFARGDVVATTLLFKLDKPVSKQFEQFPGAVEHYEGAVQDVNALSSDFLFLEKRARDFAKEEARRELGSSGWKYAFWQAFAPIVLGLAVSYISFLVLWNTRLVAAETKLESWSEQNDLIDRLSALERKVDTLNAEELKRESKQKVN